MKHKMPYYLHYTTNISGKLKLDPYDYLDCEDEDEIEDVIWDKLTNDDIPGNCELEYNDWTIPDSFWEEWRKLKAEQNE